MTPIQTAIDTLITSEPLSASVADRIYVAPGPQGVPRPYVTVQLIDDTPLFTLDGWTGCGRAHLQADVWALSLAEAVEIAGVVRDRMLSISPDVTFINRMADFEADTRLHRVSQDFAFWYDERATA